jgi:2-phosphoglycerate kinase
MKPAARRKQVTANPQPRIILITGNMAAGKSSVAQALAKRLTKSVHLRGDIFRRVIVNRQSEMTLNLSDEAYQQLQLQYRLAATAARHYLQKVSELSTQVLILSNIEKILNKLNERMRVLPKKMKSNSQ